MPYRRKGSVARKASKRMVKAMNVRRISRVIKGFPITNITRKALRFDVYLTASQDITLNFSLSQVPNPSDFTNLFDFYRINAIKLHFIPQANMNSTGSLDPLSIPVIHYMVDQDDSIGFANETQALEKEGIKTRRLDKPFTYYLKPRVSTEIYNNGITTAYALNRRAQWIDCNSSGVAHFGLKGWITTASASTMRLKVYATYYMQFKGAQ